MATATNVQSPAGQAGGETVHDCDVFDSERWSDGSGDAPLEKVAGNGTLTASAETAACVASEPRGQYRCECGHLLRVFGGGRHRVYFEPTNARLDDPVMDRACPQCGRGLPGKNAP